MVEVTVDTARECQLWDALPDCEALIERAAEAALSQSRVKLMPQVELSVMLADDAEVRRVNAHWRDKNQPTNVLSFPSVEPKKLAKTPYLGDLILAFETISREAETDGKTLSDHLGHLIVHGVLHLVGYDHMTDKEAEEMEALEIEILASLGIADPYSEYELVSAHEDENDGSS